MIEHDNIIYVSDIAKIGGVETYLYELVKKYKDIDIGVVYKSADPKQLERLEHYCYLYKHTGQKIKCNVAIINWDTSIIDYICPEIWAQNLKPDDKRGIYQGIHADWANSIYQWKPLVDSRIKTYLCITKYLMKSYPEYTGNTNVELCYNPLDVDSYEKPIVIVSATRLHEAKGKAQMIQLMNELDKLEANYLWFILTNDTNEIDNEHVVYLSPRLDVWRFLYFADYVALFSKSEACSYTLNEALYRNIPILVTPLPYLKEFGVKDGVNAYIMNFDGSNAADIAKKLVSGKKLEFDFKRPKDNYAKYLWKGKSHYKDESKFIFVVRADIKFRDVEASKEAGKDIFRVIDEEFEVPRWRARDLENKKLVTIIDKIDPDLK